MCVRVRVRVCVCVCVYGSHMEHSCPILFLYICKPRYAGSDFFSIRTACHVKQFWQRDGKGNLAKDMFWIVDRRGLSTKLFHADDETLAKGHDNE